MRAWLTPENAPTSPVCWRVFSPGGEEFEAILRGALAPLSDPENYEQYGAVTPEETAQAFLEATAITYGWERCVPVGTILFLATFDIPSNCLACDGREVAIADYPLLYAAIDSIFGGNDVDVFNVPDLRTRFPMGYDEEGTPASSVGSFGGEVAHTLSSDELPGHTHTQPTHAHAVAPHTHPTTVGTLPIVAAPGAIPADGPSIPGATGPDAGQNTSAAGDDTTGSTGGSEAHNNMSPWLALNPVIVAW